MGNAASAAAPPKQPGVTASAIIPTAVMAVRWLTVYIELDSWEQVRNMTVPRLCSSSGSHTPFGWFSSSGPSSPDTTTTLVGGVPPSGP